MFAMVKNMWRMGNITEPQIDTLVSLGRLTQEQADEIEALPRPE